MDLTAPLLSTVPRLPAWTGRDLDTLKILIVSTPKTGNTWVKHLLSETYALPIVKLGPLFDSGAMEAAGQRWIGHQHLLPNHELVEWGRRNNVVFITTIRHPGDVLVSLWHHVRNHCVDAAAGPMGQEMLRDDSSGMGEHTRHFVDQGFHVFLNLSIAWMHGGLAVPVHYESLWDRPQETLRALTDAVLPVTEERLRRAVSMCDLDAMQSLLDPAKKFFRGGGVGSWQAALPQDIKERLGSLDPYPAQLATLEYTMEPGDPANAPRRTRPQSPSPFGPGRTFDNGVGAAPAVIGIYYDLPPAERKRWPDPRSTAPGSFYAWLNSPARADPELGGGLPPVTELAHRLHGSRPDIHAAFPEPFGASRAAFLEWFIFDAVPEYGLDHAFAAVNPFPGGRAFADGTLAARVIVRIYLELPPPLRERWPVPAATGEDSFLAWLNAPAPADPFAGRVAPAVSQLGACLHAMRPDVAGAMPDLYVRHRVDFAGWFMTCAVREYDLDRAFTLPFIRSWNSPAPAGRV